MERAWLKPILCLAAIALGALAWTGCGGGSSGTASTSTSSKTASTTSRAIPTSSRTVPTATMSRAEFVNRVEAICSRGRLRGLRFQPTPKGTSESAAMAQAIESTLLPSLQGVVDQVYALGAPAAEKAQTEAFLDALQHAVTGAEELDQLTLEALEGLLGPAGKIAQRDGLQTCIFG
ncbi:MAG TPA: hypothetical protein VLK56_11095 [Solirubrobacterales bacterium]|nr:hypothetical protein [Solirubrobacterales bacterium]